MERWGTVDWIVGYEGSLEVSDRGRVRRGRLTYKTHSQQGTEFISYKPAKLLAQERLNSGYLAVAIYRSRKRQRLLVHRLVARAFVPGYKPGLTVNHINGDKTDNQSENLEWVTLSRNTALQWQTGLVDLRGDNHPSRVLNSEQVRAIKTMLKFGVKPPAIAPLLGVSTSTIYKISQGVRWRDTV